MYFAAGAAPSSRAVQQAASQVTVAFAAALFTKARAKSPFERGRPQTLLCRQKRVLRVWSKQLVPHERKAGGRQGIEHRLAPHLQSPVAPAPCLQGRARSPPKRRLPVLKPEPLPLAPGCTGSWLMASTCEERDNKGLHAFPSKITRDDPPITGIALRREGLQGITRLSF